MSNLADIIAKLGEKLGFDVIKEAQPRCRIACP